MNIVVYDAETSSIIARIKGKNNEEIIEKCKKIAEENNCDQVSWDGNEGKLHCKYGGEGLYLMTEKDYEETYE